MIEYLIPIGLFVVIWHISYEKMLLPVLLEQLRYKLFSERDNLRKLLINSEVEEQDFETLHRFINVSLKNIKELNIISMMLFIFFEKHLITSEESKQYNEKIKSIMNASNSEVKKVWENTMNISLNIAFLNAGSWLLYLLPFSLMAKMIFAIGKKFKGLDRNKEEFIYYMNKEYDMHIATT